MEIAKLRAARMLFSKIAAAFKAREEAKRPTSSRVHPLLPKRFTTHM
jgi:methylmalonyl-CoA mutase N-terminal domain/subunit